MSWKNDLSFLVQELAELRKHEWIDFRKAYKNLGWSANKLRSFEKNKKLAIFKQIEQYADYLGYEIQFRIIPKKGGIKRLLDTDNH